MYVISIIVPLKSFEPYEEIITENTDFMSFFMLTRTEIALR